MGEQNQLSTLDRVGNASVVTGRVLAETPSAIWDELSYDLSQRRGQVAQVAGLSTGLGFGATTLLTRAPRVGGLILAGALGYQAYQYGRETLGFLSEASSTSNEAYRDALVDRGRSAMGREGALLVESSPGLFAGGYLASRLVGTPALYNSVGRFSDSYIRQPIANVTSRAANVVSETYAFHGPGRMRLPASTVTAEGNVNVLEISETLGPHHRWGGVETGRSVDLLRSRISRPVSGMESHVDVPYSNRPGRLTYHTHGPENPMGGRPSLHDIVNTRDLGIIQRGNQTTFYVGRASEVDAAISSGVGDRMPLDLKAIVLDSERQTAFLLESTWQSSSRTWSPMIPQYVDYQRARSTLRALDITNPWSQIERIPSITKSTFVAADLEPLTWGRTIVAPPTPAPQVSPLMQRWGPRMSDTGPVVLMPAATIFDARSQRPAR